MHPILQMSMAFEYLFDPRRISGALYHLVATYSVKTGGWPVKSEFLTVRASPKSAILTKQSELSNTFDGFKSQ